MRSFLWLGLALVAAAGCGDLERTANVRKGCEASCRIAFECAFGSPGAVPGCTDACVDQLDAKSQACRDATAALGECADGLSCADFSAGTCRTELDESTAACNPTDAGPSDGGAGDGAAGDGGMLTGCARFEYVASGVSCESTGCSGVMCDCEVGFPASVTACTEDGCIVEANCAEVCEADLSEFVGCTDVYTVRPGADAGTDAGTVTDAGTDAGTVTDAGTDAGTVTDAGTDAGPTDAGCVPTTCAAEGAECGTISDGCGTTLTCGPCTSPATCNTTTRMCECPPGGSVTASAGMGADVAGAGTVTWTTPGNVTASDGATAVASLRGTSPQSRYLVARDFGLAVPSGATIDGISARVERRSGGRVNDVEVRLADGTTLSATNHAMTAAWPTTLGYATYGGATDTWGETWTAADVNAATFGVAISAGFLGGGPDDAEVDHVEVTVHYSIACP